MEFGVFVQRVEIHDDSLVIRPMGNTIGLRPPLIITAAEMDELPGRFARPLRQVGDRLGPNIAAPPVAAPDPATEECSACAVETCFVPPSAPVLVSVLAPPSVRHFSHRASPAPRDRARC